MQSAVTTWQAYNGWGGASLYTGTNGRADVVSFARYEVGEGIEKEVVDFAEEVKAQAAAAKQ
jgi:translation elongation factor EF-Ts